MAKKLVAVTGIKHNGKFYSAGETLEPRDFTKEALKLLHDSGALVVSDDATAEDVKAEAEAEAAPVTPATSTPSVPATPATPSVKVETETATSAKK